MLLLPGRRGTRLTARRCIGICWYCRFVVRNLYWYYSDAKVFFRIYNKLSEDTETVTLEEELRLGEKIDATVEHEGDGQGHYGAQLRGVAGVYAEGHQAPSRSTAPVGSVAGSTQNDGGKCDSGATTLLQVVLFLPFARERCRLCRPQSVPRVVANSTASAIMLSIYLSHVMKCKCKGNYLIPK